jgi:hypothetical protein
VTADSPVLFSLGDLHKGKSAVLGAVKEYGFTTAKLWDSAALIGAKSHLESEARHIWATDVLKEIKDNTLIHSGDIPLLERAYKDSQLNIRIAVGKGPELEIIKPTSKQQLWDLIKESKLNTANQVLKKMSLDGSIPIEQGTAAAAKIANTKVSYLEGTPSANEFADLMAYQSAAADYTKSLTDKGLSTSVGEAVDPLYLPKYSKIVYGLDKTVGKTDETVLDAVVHYKQKQAAYQQQAKNVVAKVLGPISENLPDITDTALISASRGGSGAGLFSAENSNYGTLGSSMAWVGSMTRTAKQAARKETSDLLESSLVALGKNQQAAIEFESINQKITRSGKQWWMYEDPMYGKPVMVADDAFKKFA